MKCEATDILARFYAIKPERIARDLRESKDRLPQVAAALARVQDIAFDDRTADDEARIAHLMMVQAHELCRAPGVLPEFKMFYAAFGTGNIVQLAETVAMDQGRLAELRRQMDEIRRREGLSPDEDWFHQGGPPDHRTLEAEADALGDRIVDTVLIAVLNRYGLTEQAKVYEHDRRQWDFLREAGSRVITGSDGDSAGVETILDQHYIESYGETFVLDLQRRVAAIREAVGRVSGKR